jgi:hypothetical protein
MTPSKRRTVWSKSEATTKSHESGKDFLTESEVARLLEGSMQAAMAFATIYCC